VVAALVADVMALATALDKPLGVRLVPIPGGRPGDVYELGGLYGRVVVMDLGRYREIPLARRSGVVPPSVWRLRAG